MNGMQTMATDEIRILIVEDEPLIAEDIASNLNATDYKVAGVAYNSDKALRLLREEIIDIAILDINIKGDKSGIDLAHIINEQYKIPFIYLTSYADKATVDKAKQTMPYGYLLKPFREKDLFSSIEMALFRFSKEHKKNLPTREKINGIISIGLTEKEYEILTDLCEGLTNKQLSEKHYISIHTVKSHVKKILQKLNVPNRTSVIHKVYESF
ncbi:MAG: response regulator [Saprospiraceae bacterium]